MKSFLKKHRLKFKGLTYKLLTTIFFVSVAYWRTGSLNTALTFGLMDAFGKYLLYTAHEYGWARALPETITEDMES